LFDFENNFENGENKELLQYRHRPFFSLMSLVLSVTTRPGKYRTIA
jgi:hypothetical protein